MIERVILYMNGGKVFYLKNKEIKIGTPVKIVDPHTLKPAIGLVTKARKPLSDNDFVEVLMPEGTIKQMQRPSLRSVK